MLTAGTNVWRQLCKDRVQVTQGARRLCSMWHTDCHGGGGELCAVSGCVYVHMRKVSAWHMQKVRAASAS